MNSIFEEALGYFGRQLQILIQKYLINECMKLKAHGYFGRQINRAYDC